MFFFLARKGIGNWKGGGWKCQQSEAGRAIRGWPADLCLIKFGVDRLFCWKNKGKSVVLFCMCVVWLGFFSLTGEGEGLVSSVSGSEVDGFLFCNQS